MRLKITSQLHIFLWLLAPGLLPGQPLYAADTTYYVSSSDGADSNTGLSSAPGDNGPFKTIAKVNALALQPGDAVLFKCGDVWRAEMLVINRSGTAPNPITFGSYPGGCADKPVLSGAHAISGWTAYGGNIYYADLSAGANAGKFANGINQLFRNGDRLPLGRWPNLDAGSGYSTIDSQPAANRFTDAQLPAVDWSGAVAHVKGMRWYILNRQVTADSGSTLTVGADLDCWGGSCTGWGYFLNNHLGTLDREGEWYYNPANKRVYLYTELGAPAAGQIEGSVVLKADDRSWGGILLGEDLSGSGISYVGVENLDVRRWFRHGIATPTNLAGYENHHVTLQGLSVSYLSVSGLHIDKTRKTPEKSEVSNQENGHRPAQRNRVGGSFPEPFTRLYANGGQVSTFNRISDLGSDQDKVLIRGYYLLWGIRGIRKTRRGNSADTLLIRTPSL